MSLQLALALALGGFAGTISSLLGVGGGIVLVPVLIYVLGLPIHQAVGTSLAVIVPTALMGVVRHYGFGNINLSIAIFLAVGAIAGAYLGAALAEMLPALVLKKIFAALLAITAVRMFLA